MRDKKFGTLVSRLINRENLSREETKSAFSMILNNEVTEMQQGALLAALNAKTETREEVAGSWAAIFENDTVKVDISSEDVIVDNCGTGMDSFKTFNISTGASIVAAAAGVKMARHGSRALSSVCGTVDLAEALGVDVECDADLVKKSIHEAGIGLFNGMSPKIHPRALGRILSQIHFGTTLNISASLANPALPEYGVRGVYSEDMLFSVAEIMKEIGYKRAIVIHGKIDGSGLGMDEASVCGTTVGAELHTDGRIEAFSFRPEDFGIALFDCNELSPESTVEESAAAFVQTLTGEGPSSRIEAVLLNAALVLYAAGKSDSIYAGLNDARKILEEGLVLDTLKNWVRIQNRNPESGLARFDSLLSGERLVAV